MAQLFIPDDYADLAAAQAAAASGDEVILRTGTYSGANNRGRTWGAGNANIIVRSETRNPEDVVIDCGGAANAMLILGTGTVLIEGLTITNGLSITAGGGIENTNPNTIVRNCIIKDCQAEDGGGISSAGAAILTENCLIKDNLAVHGGGVYATTGKPTIKQSTIADNDTAGVGSGGGGIYSDTGDADLEDCIVWGNSDANNNGHQILTVGGAFTLDYCCYRNTPNDIVGVITPTNSITTDPRFVTSGTRTNLLSQKAAGEVLDSPCWDTGSQSAAAADMDDKTTRTDAVADQSIVDMGFHYFTAAPCLTGPCGAPGGLMSINNMLAQINCLLRNYYAGLIAGLDPDCVVRAIAVDADGHIVLGTLLEEWTTTWPVTMQDAVSVPLGATSALSAVLDLRRARGAAITSHVAFHALAAGDVVIRAYSSTDNVTYSTVPIAEMRAVCNPGNTEVVPMRIGAEFSYVKVTAENLDVAQAAVVTTIGEKKLTQETCD